MLRSFVLPTNMGDYVFIDQMDMIGDVWRGARKDTQEKVLIKIMNKDVLKNQKTQTSFVAELSLLKRLQHPLVVPFLEVLENDSSYYLVFDFPQNGVNLTSYIESKGTFSDDAAKNFISQLIDFFDYFQNPEFKNSKILITNDTILVSEDGKIEKVYVSVDGSPLICSSSKTVASFQLPENVNGQQVSAPAYTWICGIFLYFIKIGRLPFTGETVEEIERSILMNHPTFDENDNISPDMMAFIKKLLTKNPVTRVPLAAIYNLPAMHSRGEGGENLMANSVKMGLGGSSSSKKIPGGGKRKSAIGLVQSDNRFQSLNAPKDQNLQPSALLGKMPLSKMGSSNRVRITPRKHVPIGRQHSMISAQQPQ